MGSRKQGERSKDPEVGGEASKSQTNAFQLQNWGWGGDPLSPPRVCPDLKRQDSATPSPRGRTMGSNYPSPGSGNVEAKRNKTVSREGPLGTSPAPAPYSVMRLASSVQAAVELAEKTR